MEKIKRKEKQGRERRRNKVSVKERQRRDTKRREDMGK